MTNPMPAELDEVVRLAEKATSGPWSHQESTSDTCGFEVVQKRLNGDVVAGEYGIHEYDDARLIAAAVNFLRTHHATLADMAKRMEAAERDSKRLDWLADRNNSVGQVLLPTASVEANLHDMRAAIDHAMSAAIDATQEGKG